MSITTELNKPEYAGISNAERLALLLSKTEPTVGRIEQGQLKVLEALIAKGLWRDKMDKLKSEGVAMLADSAATAEQKQLANIKLQVVSGFHEAISETKLANKAPAAAGGHSVNMNDPMVQQTFAAAQMPGVQLITADEAAKVIELATFQRQLYPEAALKDIVAHFQPELIDGEWHEIEATKAQILKFKLNSRPPEMTHIIVESQDMTETWGFAATIHSIQSVNPLPYIGVVPYFGEARKLRWKCEYKLDGEMEAVHFEEPI